MFFRKKTKKFGLLTFGSGTIDGGQAVSWDGDLAIGTVLYVTTDSGEQLPVPQGTYMLTTTDGLQYTVETDDTGKIVSLQPVASPTQSQSAAMRAKGRVRRLFESAVTSDGKTLQWDGELTVGTVVNEVLPDGTTQPANGDYEVQLPDGSTAVVTCQDGVVVAISVVAEDQSAMIAAQMQAIVKQVAELGKKVESIEAKFESFARNFSHASGKNQNSSIVDIAQKIRRV